MLVTLAKALSSSSSTGSVATGVEAGALVSVGAVVGVGWFVSGVDAATEVGACIRQRKLHDWFVA